MNVKAYTSRGFSGQAQNDDAEHNIIDSYQIISDQVKR